MSTPETHGVLMEFGKHQGERITRVPVSYLRWMVNEGTPQADLAAAELMRRGTVFPEIDISGHAIDRASIRFLKQWEATRQKDEGLHAWLVRMATAAIRHEAGTRENDRMNYSHQGITFCFKAGLRWPVLLTVKGNKRRRHG